MKSNSLLTYYGDIIPDHDQFYEAITTPLPTCFWVNTLKINPDQLQQLLIQDRFNIKPLLWHPQAIRCFQSPISLGKRWEYLSGLLQVQEEVAMIPAVILNPNLNEVVLDLCAAPGNKTAQMSIMMQNQGTLIANDRDYYRMRAFGQISKRLGLLNITITTYDGTAYPGLGPYFDKILVDAPCSGEGTIRKKGDKEVRPNREGSLIFGKVQKNLLQKAIQLCKPGGKILYSTCTFAPEENERVLHEILQENGDQVHLLPINIPQFKTCPGITEWRDEKYDSSVKQALRIWPHLNDSGGFFIALFEKKLEPESSKYNYKLNLLNSEIFESSSLPSIDEHKSYINKLYERFGFPADMLTPFRLTQDSKKGIYITNKDNSPPAIKKDITGLLFLKTQSHIPKLTTAISMLFGQYAVRNKVEITSRQLENYLNQKDFLIEQKQLQNCTGNGYVMLIYQGIPIGMAHLFYANDNQPHLRSLFPKYLK